MIRTTVETSIKSSADFFSRIMQRWLPDAFLFAVILSAIVFICGLLFQDQTPVQMADHWGNGFWKLLSFSMQMVLILVLGHVLAMSRPVQTLLSKLASLAKTPTQAVVLVTGVSIIAAWINWGFGLVVGALVAREVATNVRHIHFPLLIASAYSGFLVWHGGLSGSIPLKLASTNQDSLNALLNGQVIEVSQTILAMENLIIVFALLISLPLLNVLMMPKENLIEFTGTETAEKTVDHTQLSPAEKLEHNPVISLLLAAMCGLYLVNYFVQGNGLNLNIINLSLLTLGVLLHGNPHNFLRAIKTAINGATGIILQFPIYAGLMGMMVQSGLADSVSNWFVEISTQDSFPVFTFISAGVVNFFVPSGGGQWAVQAPIVIPAAQSLSVPINNAAMAVAWGDAWTNMIQPFWALPLLGIAGLNIRQIMGFCTVVFIWSGILIGSLIYFLY
ncbi:short-chain fatty acid transporter [Aliikangiella coralliicola]|uniref:Short-chain fatty acid transporter n=1 Tax=Aliikangiella coralliicola TaxID=2592383 RepID=A0A545UG00_9GAMM|nr:TIGR00366 family protein [Aliikangiella coralliicola]TQV88400.1 short-chain fatty acid transporter [Aliikangiella coralliicola]